MATMAIGPEKTLGFVFVTLWNDSSDGLGGKIGEEDIQDGEVVIR